jgi:hypothetical protein
MNFKEFLDIVIRLMTIVLLAISIYAAYQSLQIVETVQEKVNNMQFPFEQGVAPDQGNVGLEIVRQYQSTN